MPLKYYVYVRDQLKRGKRVSFQIASTDALLRECGSTVRIIMCFYNCKKMLHCEKISPRYLIPPSPCYEIQKPLEIQINNVTGVPMSAYEPSFCLCVEAGLLV